MPKKSNNPNKVVKVGAGKKAKTSKGNNPLPVAKFKGKKMC